MRTKAATGILIVGAALVWARVPNGQVQPAPGPGTGRVTVEGTVNIGNVPVVETVQRGDWKVSVANAPEVRVVNTPVVGISPLPFLKVGGRYEVVWGAGEREVLVIAQLGSGAWARVETPGRRRWLNLSAARAIEEIS
jgi:hypothetical protein